jgi:N-acetylneuraminate synthase
MIRIVAEIGSVHDGSFGNAQRLIELAAVCGADIVKFQTHIPEAETLPDAPSPPYFAHESRFEYFRRTGFSPHQWKALAVCARSAGAGFLSSPFSLEAVDLLEEVGIDAYKIPSGEVTNLPLLEHVARTGKPVYLSSGMSDWAELDRAVAALRKGGPLVVMQCTSRYPCAPEEVGLNIVAEMQARYGVPVGFSDHTPGFAAAIAAATLGAMAIEKHFTFSRAMYGSDAQFAMEPDAFRQYCTAIREAWRMREHPVDKNDISAFVDMKRIFEKSVVTAVPVKAGTVLRREHLAFKKPGDGISAARYSELIGRCIKADLPANYMLKESDLG